jgi:hypothetical protein
MSPLLLQHCGAICFLAHAPDVVKMAWYGDAHFKQWAVIEPPVAEKAAVMNIYMWLSTKF